MASFFNCAEADRHRKWRKFIEEVKEQPFYHVLTPQQQADIWIRSAEAVLSDIKALDRGTQNIEP
jgi:hypothetical protein